MANLTLLAWTFICFTSLRGIEPTKIYVLGIPNADTTKILDAYDDYDLVSGNDYKDLFKPKITTGTREITPNKPVKLHKNLCQRLFGSMYGNRAQQIKCLETLKQSQIADTEKQTEIPKIHPLYIYNKHTRQKKEPVYRFSQDYLDVNDLVRSEDRFADNYVDIDDFRALEGFRKKLPKASRSDHKIRYRRPFSEDLEAKARSGTSEFESEEGEERRGPKPSRYKVVTEDNPQKEGDGNSDESGESVGNGSSNDDNNNAKDGSSKDDSTNSSSEEQKPVVEDEQIASDVDMAGDTSIELTTKKPKTKSKSAPDQYVYLQGNKVYSESDFRRRIPHFLPKRYAR